MNGALRGLSKGQINHRFPEIGAFADIGEFIDQPVKSYSSGMFMRLAFATAIHVGPAILVIDEILAVGYENFQTKCRQRLQEFRETGKTILLVYHNLIENICSRVHLLHKGAYIVEGKPSEVISVYNRLLYGENVSDQYGCKHLGNIKRSAYTSFQRKGNSC